jgi:hypothetical protein
MANELSIICFVHNIGNRGACRLNNFLYSIRNQDSDISPEIMIVDISNDSSFTKVNDLCAKYDANHIYKKMRGKIWNKSQGLNIGIKRSKSKYTMCTDVDYIFKKNFISTLWKEKHKKYMLLCKVHMLGKKDDVKEFSMRDFDGLNKKGRFFGKNSANGACQFTNTSWFKKVRGYDEKLAMWGGMDNDMVFRARSYGLSIKWLHTKTAILHQWHPIFKINKLATAHRTENEKRLNNKRKMRRSGNNSFVVANEKAWGIL